MNHRYLDKRALYLNVVACELQKHAAFSNVHVTSFRGDPAKPILVIEPASTAASPTAPSPKGKLANAKGAKHQLSKELHIPKRFSVRIIPALSLARPVIPLAKLAPDRNNVRSHKSASSETVFPTPYYNQQICEDYHFLQSLKELHGLVTEVPAAVDAIILLKVCAPRSCVLVVVEKYRCTFSVLPGCGC